MGESEVSSVTQKASYDAFASYYREYSHHKRNYIRAIDNAIVERVSEARSILDFGAGDGVRGANLKQALGGNYLVQGDISTEMLKCCSRVGAADRLVDTSIQGWQDTLDGFDLIFALWNVLGLVVSEQERIETLTMLRSLMNKNGVLVFDVNNRHNTHYGKIKSLYRRFLDTCLPDSRRGDAQFIWNINGEEFPAYGHLFTLNEVLRLLRSAGFSDIDWLAVDYDNGQVSHHASSGQLLFLCRS